MLACLRHLRRRSQRHCCTKQLQCSAVCLLLLLIAVWWLLNSKSPMQQLAEKLEIRFEVVENGPNHHSGRIRLRNPLWVSALASGRRWRLYFSLRGRLKSYQLPQSYQLPPSYQNRVKFEHVSGSLHRVDLPGGLAAGAELSISFSSSENVVSRFDVYPNWYVVEVTPEGEEAEPQVVACTAGERNDFVEALTRPEQFLRSPGDPDAPWSPEDRRRRQAEYLGKERPQESLARVVPRPVASESLGSAVSTVGILAGLRFSVDAGCDAADKVVDFLRQRQRELTAGRQKSSSSLKPFSVSLCSRQRDRRLLQQLGRRQLRQFQLDAAYSVSVDIAGGTISLRSFRLRGLFYAAQTLLAMLHEPGLLNVRHVLDYPRMEHRGLVVDVARNMQPLSALLQIVDAMATYKMNKLQLHATDDEGVRLPLTSAYQFASRRCHDRRRCQLPQLGSHPTSGQAPGSGHYSADEYSRLLRYASDRFVEVIPEVDMPAHSYAFVLAHQQLGVQLSDPLELPRPVSLQGFRNNTINPCLPATKQFVHRVFADLLRLHDAAGVALRSFHFGGDEPPAGMWTQSPACAGRGGRDSLNRQFVSELLRLAAGHGVGLMGWEDGFRDGGPEETPYQLDELMPDGRRRPQTTATWWIPSPLGDTARRLANAGHRVVLAAATHLYLDHPQEPSPDERGLQWATRFIDLRRVFEFDAASVVQNVSQERADKVVGVAGALWGEMLRNQRVAFEMLLPRLLAVAERAWHRASWEAESDAERRRSLLSRDWAEFVSSIGYRELPRLVAMRLPFYLGPPAAEFSPDTRRLVVSHLFPGVRLFHSVDSPGDWREGSDVILPPAAQFVMLKAALDKDATETGAGAELFVESRVVKLQLRRESL